MQSVSFSMLHCYEGDHMLADHHVHTKFSDDSVYPLDAVCRDAISFRYGLPDLQPCAQTLKLYREPGGRAPIRQIAAIP